MSSPSAAVLPVSAEGILLVTLQGRIMILQSAPPGRLGNVSMKLQDIKICLHQRLQMMMKHLPKANATVDPIVGFTYILAYSLLIHVNELAEGMTFGMDEHQKSLSLCLEEAFDASSEISSLAKSSCRLGRFKVCLWFYCAG